MSETASRPESVHTDVFWRELEVAEGETATGRIADLELHVENLPGEWRTTLRRGEGSGGIGWSLQTSAGGAEDDPEAGHPDVRHVLEDSGGPLRVRPQLADLPVVVRPSTEVAIARGEHATIFVGTPLWVELEVSSAGREPVSLLDAPVEMLSQTWFGRGTREGELCYACETRARLHIENLVPQPDIAVTEVSVSNSGDEPLRFDAFQLPAPALSIFRGPRGWFWTERVSVTQVGAGGPAELQIEGVPSTPGRKADRIRGPRRETGGKSLVSTFGSLLPFGRRTV